MTHREWTHDNLSELSIDYLNKVLNNMTAHGATVRFGTTGKVELSHARPNYEISYPDGRQIPFNSLSHNRFKDTEHLDIEKVSRSFSYNEVKGALAEAVFG